MTGKAIVPIVDLGAGRWKYDLQDIHHELQGEDEVSGRRTRLSATTATTLGA